MKPKKIVIQVSMRCDKCRNKALKIASGFKGVSSVAIEGDDKDRVAVTGIEVDSVCLVRRLRKKFCKADIVSVEEVKDKKKEEDKTKICYYAPYPTCPPIVCQEYQDTSCIVM